MQFRYDRADIPDFNTQAEKIGKAIASEMGLPLVSSKRQVQWGAVFVDDQRRLFVSEIVTSFNPTWTKAQIETELKKVLEVSEVHWFPPLPKERTGHLDIYAKYVGNNTLLVARSDVPERRSFLKDMAIRFREDFGFKILRIANAESSKKASLPFTYTNSLILNGVAFIPSYAQAYGDEDPLLPHLKERDDEAMRIYESLGFKPKDIIQIPSRDLIGFDGTIHCLTSQIN